MEKRCGIWISNNLVNFKTFIQHYQAIVSIVKTLYGLDMEIYNMHKNGNLELKNNKDSKEN